MAKALIIGGTGSLGHAVAPLLLRKGYSVTILSREELKQKEMAKKFPSLDFVLGDIRDFDSIEPHCIGKEVVFHFAAMKHVEVAEKNPDEAIKVNLLGTVNVAKAVKRHCDYAVFSSTDKAVLPINVYGMTKALSEAYWLSQNKGLFTKYSVFRWGNVLGSRGSVIHYFLETLKREKTVYITHPEMTRFFIKLSDAASFMVENFKFPELNGPMIPVMRASSITALAEACAYYLGIFDYKTVFTGIRPGEKLHEVLDHHDHPSFTLSSDQADQLSKEDLFLLIKEFICQES